METCLICGEPCSIYRFHALCVPFTVRRAISLIYVQSDVSCLDWNEITNLSIHLERGRPVPKCIICNILISTHDLDESSSICDRCWFDSSTDPIWTCLLSDGAAMASLTIKQSSYLERGD